jgi:hypothetical protein
MNLRLLWLVMLTFREMFRRFGFALQRRLARLLQRLGRGRAFGLSEGEIES